MIRTEQIETAAVGWLQRVDQNGSCQVERAASVEMARPGDLVFAAKADQLALALNQGASILVVHASLAQQAASSLGKNRALYSTPHVGLAMARILPLFDRKSENYAQQTPPIHPRAVVDPTAQLAQNVVVGAGAVIGARAQIGAGSWIGANTVIEADVRIGARCLIHPCVFVGARCELGDACEVHPHTTIGSDGFGFAQDKDFKHHKLPQLGRVVLGSHVEIGANCAIDRAAFGETRIGSGTKMDNLCHVAHNCEIGEDSVIAGGFFVAGSSKIGKRFMVGGSAVVSDHVQITDGVILAGRATVTNDITQPGAYGGYPLQPLKESLKTIANLAHLTEMRKQLARLLKHFEGKNTP